MSTEFWVPFRALEKRKNKMSYFLGIDTSNYTTSLALCSSPDGAVLQQKSMLEVPDGQVGLRQSDAVFLHTKAAPDLMQRLFSAVPKGASVCAVGYSRWPRREQGSYMPCFLVGETLAKSIAAVLGVKAYAFSHQEGHVMAALYGSGRLDWIQKQFLAFHVSGGTTEALLVSPDVPVFTVKKLASSLDVKAGQVIDRVGAALDLPFPAGASMDLLMEKSENKTYMRPTLKGLDCCLSGLENQCKALILKQTPPEDVADYCIRSVCETLREMAKKLTQEYPGLPILFAGGVMSNRFIKQQLSEAFDCAFAPAAFSSDNAAGTALLCKRIYEVEHGS